MTDLHLVRLPLDLRTFTAWALHWGYMDSPPRDGRGKPRDAEIGYAVHAALTGLFGMQAPRPFVVSPLGQRERRRSGIESSSRAGIVDLLGYAGTSIDTLRTLGQLAGDELRATIDWDGASSRPMPPRWPKNLRLRFDLRACPVRRIMKPLATSARPNLPAATLSKGSEVDAFQVAVVRARDGSETLPARDRIYLEWLSERFASRPDRPQAAALVPNSVRVGAYRSVRLLRRPRAENGFRSAQWLTRPDVSFTGLLEVADPDAFPALLASGIGRHCGFGFGMLLLRPA